MKTRRGWGWPLVPVYWAGLRVKDGLRAWGVLPVRGLGWPVVSVGSLSAGGAGKTPVVMALAELLAGRGWRVDVLSRGYGRAGRGVQRVDAGAEDAAGRFGDEPVLIARRTGVEVWVGAERFAAGSAAEMRGGTRGEADCSAALRNDTSDGVRDSEGWGRRVHVLDDGFQHRELGRGFDVVVVTAEDLDEALLPAGNRREPLGALRRADAVVVREDEAAGTAGRVRGLVRAGVPVWVVRRRIVVGAPTGEDGVVKDEAPGRSGQDAGGDDGGGVVAFCGIARPEGFFRMLRQAGVRVAAEVRFPDHHRYTMGDVSRLVESCHLETGDVRGARGFVTTEKDAVKMNPEFRARLEEAGPLRVARLETEFVEPDAVVGALEARLG